MTGVCRPETGSHIENSTMYVTPAAVSLGVLCTLLSNASVMVPVSLIRKRLDPLGAPPAAFQNGVAKQV